MTNTPTYRIRYAHRHTCTHTHAHTHTHTRTHAHTHTRTRTNMYPQTHASTIMRTYMTHIMITGAGCILCCSGEWISGSVCQYFARYLAKKHSSSKKVLYLYMYCTRWASTNHIMLFYRMVCTHPRIHVSPLTCLCADKGVAEEGWVCHCPCCEPRWICGELDSCYPVKKWCVQMQLRIEPTNTPSTSISLGTDTYAPFFILHLLLCASIKNELAVHT